MYKDYNSFLNEANDKKVEKKSKEPTLVLIYSDKFRDCLTAIQNMKPSNISKRLLDLEKDKDKLFDFSYIDITKDGDSISYLQANRVERFKSENKPESEYWTSKSRVTQKIGRFIKLVAPTFSDKSIELFGNKFKTIVKEEDELVNFELVEGDDIVYWYNYKNYESENGTLGGSCMSGDECGGYFNIYKDNPKQCKLLILKTSDGEKIKGRALVWKLSKPEDKIFMDRVYTNKESDEMLFTNYAKRQGWLYKDEQKYGVTNIVEPGKGSKSMNLEVKLDNVEHEDFPYVDTLRYYYPDEGIMRNYEDRTSDNKKLYTLTDTEGKYQEYGWGDEFEDPMVYDAYNKQEIPESSAVWCETDNAYCSRNDALRLAYNGTFALPNSPNIVLCEYNNKTYNKKDVVFSKPLNSWIWNKYSVDVYHDKDKKQKDQIHRFELDKTIGKVGDNYYDLDLLKVIGSKQVPVKDKPGKFKTEYIYDFKD